MHTPAGDSPAVEGDTLAVAAVGHTWAAAVAVRDSQPAAPFAKKKIDRKK